MYGTGHPTTAASVPSRWLSQLLTINLLTSQTVRLVETKIYNKLSSDRQQCCQPPIPL